MQFGPFDAVGLLPTFHLRSLNPRKNSRQQLSLSAWLRHSFRLVRVVFKGFPLKVPPYISLVTFLSLISSSFVFGVEVTNFAISVVVTELFMFELDSEFVAFFASDGLIPMNLPGSVAAPELSWFLRSSFFRHRCCFLDMGPSSRFVSIYLVIFDYLLLLLTPSHFDIYLSGFRPES